MDFDRLEIIYLHNENISIHSTDISYVNFRIFMFFWTSFKNKILKTIKNIIMQLNLS